MELRFVRRNWDKGKFALQFRETAGCDWQDVPTEDSKMKKRSLEERLGLQDSRWKEPMKKDYDLDDPVKSCYIDSTGVVQHIGNHCKGICDLEPALDCGCSKTQHRLSTCMNPKPKESPVSGEYWKCCGALTSFKYCGYCGAVRPKTIKEQLSNLIKERWEKPFAQNSMKELYDDLADIAIDFLKSRKGEF